jgi:glutamate 5-kinase
VEKINEKIFKMASNETNMYGTGGMSTKLQAAEIAMSCGCSTIICNGNISKPIRSFLKTSYGTLFVSVKKTKNKLKNWIAGTVKPSGRLIIDDGASTAIFKGASLLPSGIVKVFGTFLKGDIVRIEDKKGLKIGKGISFYDSLEIKKIMGKKTTDLKNILGYHGRDEIIHRDCLTLND